MNPSPDGSLVYIAWGFASILLTGLVFAGIRKMVISCRTSSKLRQLRKLTSMVNIEDKCLPYVVSIADAKRAVSLYEELRLKPMLVLPFMDQYFRGLEQILSYEFSVAKTRLREAHEKTSPQEVITDRLVELEEVERKLRELKEIKYSKQQYHVGRDIYRVGAIN